MEVCFASPELKLLNKYYWVVLYDVGELILLVKLPLQNMRLI